ncbi:DUF4192 domain-containing protein [Nocardia sp. BMG51109]|uniref:DUF4192 domain-containing protein n=1 Tax=Nocardia sp. BMG51109 TaxID=1056816 RepID=UPI0004668E7B|nr:DUF4192 domain-containing protein [Nocardia sp. BMG51109]
MTIPAEPAPAADDPRHGDQRREAPWPGGDDPGPRAHSRPAGPEHEPADGRAAPDCPASDEPPWIGQGLRIDAPAEFIAAVPALLGFVPHRSLVACLLREVPDRPGSVFLGALARHDLDAHGCGVWVRSAGHLAALCAHEDAVGVLVLIVDDRAGAPRAGRPGARAARHRDLVGVLGGALRAEGVELADAWAVREIAAEAPWWDLLEPGSVGRQRDPSASPIALAQVLDGRPIRASRAEMTVLLEVDPDSREAVAAVLDEVCAAARERYRQAVCRCDPTSYSRAALDLVLRRVAEVGSDDGIEPVDLAEVAVALRDSTVRDAMFALALGDRAAPAEVLWSLLCRSLTGSDRAEAATLLGYSAYVNGDGPFAGVALEAALEADPRHGIAELLDTALRTGMPPSEVRKLGLSGRTRAAGLGVEIAIGPAR